MQDPNDLLHHISFAPGTLGAAFPNPLLLKDELLLGQLEIALRRKVHAVLDRALAGGPEIAMTQRERADVLEMSAFQKEILHLLKTRGRLGQRPDVLN